MHGIWESTTVTPAGLVLDLALVSSQIIHKFFFFPSSHQTSWGGRSLPGYSIHPRSQPRILHLAMLRLNSASMLKPAVNLSSSQIPNPHLSQQQFHCLTVVSYSFNISPPKRPVFLFSKPGVHPIRSKSPSGAARNERWPSGPSFCSCLTDGIVETRTGPPGLAFLPAPLADDLPAEPAKDSRCNNGAKSSWDFINFSFVPSSMSSATTLACLETQGIIRCISPWQNATPYSLDKTRESGAEIPKRPR